MTSYTNVFGGNNVNTAFPSYISYEIDADLQLTWATSFVDNSNVTAILMDVNATEEDLFVILPSATSISRGQSIQINNVGAESFSVNDGNGGFLVTIATSEIFFLYLTNNSTAAGIWNIVQFGTGTSQAQANLLAGLGTKSLAGKINTNFPSQTVSASYVATSDDRASLLIWDGGVGTITLPTIVDVAQGYYIGINNVGGGIVTINTTDGTTIDNQATFSLTPGQSSYFIAVDPNWNTLGFGTETYFQANVLAPLDISGAAVTTLTTQQAAPLIQQFTGALVQNVTVKYPGSSGQWYVWNNTSNAFSVSLQLETGGNIIEIPQGTKYIIYSDGNNLYSVPTVITTVVFSSGSVATPSIHFSSSPNSGFYRITNTQMGYSASATLSLSFGTTGLNVQGGRSTRYYNTANTFYSELKGGEVGANVSWTLPLLDATSSGQIIYSNAAGTLAFTSAAYPTSTTINQILYSSAANTITGLATANNGILITSGGGVPSISSTLPTAVQGNITSTGILASGTWNATPITVPFGGTGKTTFTAYSVVCAGTTATGVFQNVVGLGTTGFVLTSNGAGALPTWQASALFGFNNNLTRRAAIIFDQTNNTIISSFNISSITFVRPGVTKIEFETPFADSSYSVLGANVTTPTPQVQECYIECYPSQNLSRVSVSFEGSL